MKSYQPTPLDSSEYFWMMNCLMYGYIPLEFREGLTTDSTQAEDSRDVPPASDASSGKINLAWQALMLGLFLSLIGLISGESAARVPQSSSMQVHNAVAEVGMPMRWKF